MVAGHRILHPRSSSSSIFHLGLSDFVVVVRKLEIDAARVNVHAAPQDVACHDRALNVPARAALMIGETHQEEKFRERE